MKISNSPSQGRAALAILAATGFGLILLPTSRFGAGLSPDSVQYIAGARSLAAGKGFAYYDGSLISRWPPIYSALLALSEVVLGVDPLQVAGFINAFLFASIILLTYLLATMLFANDRKSTVLATLLTLLSVPLQEVSLMAWSEPLFILLALIFLISLQVFLRDGATTKLLLMTATAAVACLTRYVGVSLIMTGVIGILLLWERPPLKKLGLAFLFGLAASLPLAVWLARNWNVSGTLLGPRSPAASTLMQNLEQSAGLLLTWLAPWLVAMIILVTAGIVVGLRRKEYTQGLGISIRRSGTLNLFTFTYLILLEYSATRTELNAVDNRYMSPLYVPLLLTALSLFTGAADLLRHRLSREGNNLIVFATSAILSWRSRFF